MKDKESLRLIYNRMVNVHGENENYDYMHKLKSIINGTDEKKDTQLIFKRVDKTTHFRLDLYRKIISMTSGHGTEFREYDMQKFTLFPESVGIDQIFNICKDNKIIRFSVDICGSEKLKNVVYVECKCGRNFIPNTDSKCHICELEWVEYFNNHIKHK